MWTSGRLGVACAGIVAMLALSGCTDGSEDPTASAEPVLSSETESSTASPTTSPVAPSFPAGVPTAEPSPAPSDEPQASVLDATVTLTLATADPDSDGMLVGGYVSGIAEDGGECEYVVTSATGATATQRTVGVENNGTTSCGSTVVPSSELEGGPYTVVLSYTNADGSAQSEPLTVEMS